MQHSDRPKVCSEFFKPIIAQRGKQGQSWIYFSHPEIGFCFSAAKKSDTRSNLLECQAYYLTGDWKIQGSKEFRHRLKVKTFIERVC